MASNFSVSIPKKNPGIRSKGNLWKGICRYKWMYLFLLPLIVHQIVFKYFCMYGVLLAFKDFKYNAGIMGSPWVGMKYFVQFVTQYNFWQLIGNTLRMTFSSLIFGFPAPIILALLINEVSMRRTKKLIQTFTYLPHFVSWVVVISIFTNLLSPNGGLVNELLNKLFGMEPKYFMGEKKYFLVMYLLLGMWKEAGWGSILYLAAITGIDPELYEAASLDGAGRLRKVLSITLPCIFPTIVIRLLLNMGGLMGVGFDQVYLMQTPTNLDVSEAINTYVVKEGIRQGHYSFATAVGLFQSVIGMMLMFVSNKISKTLTETSLW